MKRSHDTSEGSDGDVVHHDQILPRELWEKEILPRHHHDDLMLKAQCRRVCRAWYEIYEWLVIPVHPILNKTLRISRVPVLVRDAFLWLLRCLERISHTFPAILDSVSIYIGLEMRLTLIHPKRYDHVYLVVPWPSARTVLPEYEFENWCRGGGVAFDDHHFDMVWAAIHLAVLRGTTHAPDWVPPISPHHFIVGGGETTSPT